MRLCVMLTLCLAAALAMTQRATAHPATTAFMKVGQQEGSTTSRSHHVPRLKRYRRQR